MGRSVVEKFVGMTGESTFLLFSFPEHNLPFGTTTSALYLRIVTPIPHLVLPSTHISVINTVHIFTMEEARLSVPYSHDLRSLIDEYSYFFASICGV